MNEIVNIIFTVLLTAISIFASIIDDTPKWLPILIVLISLMLLWITIVSKIRIKKQLDEETKKLKSLMAEMSINADMNNVGNRLLLMSLTQDIAEPLKIKYLEKALNEYDNVLAGLLLGNIYSNTIEKNGETIITADWDKAAEIYKKLKDIDNYGVSQWMLGWCYQNRFTKDAKNMNPDECNAKALEFYHKSLELRFPKAYNSLANLMQNNIVPNGDELQMIHYYKMASELNDIYATINCGILYFKKYKKSRELTDFECAEKYLLKAIEYESPNSYLYLSNLYIECFKITNDADYLSKAKSLLVKLIVFGANQFTASAYVILGQQLKEHKSLIDDEIRKLFPSKNDDEIPLECLLKAKDVFEYLTRSGKMISKENQEYYNHIKNAI